MDFWKERNEELFQKIMFKRGYIKEKRGEFEVWVKPKKEKPLMFSGRPDRERAINNNDITNLKILLNISRTLEEFINNI